VEKNERKSEIKYWTQRTSLGWKGILFANPFQKTKKWGKEVGEKPDQGKKGEVGNQRKRRENWGDLNWEHERLLAEWGKDGLEGARNHEHRGRLGEGGEGCGRELVVG